MEFVPFDVTEDEASDWQVLRPGAPATMRKALVTWIWDQVKSSYQFSYPSALHEIENALDVDFGLNPSYAGLMDESTVRKLIDNLGERDLIRVVDFLLYKGGKAVTNRQALSQILSRGRSMYEVVEREQKYRLAPRLPEGVQDAADALIAKGETAGMLLRKAWNKVYDLEPDDSGAYMYAVRAVEAASFPVLGITKELAQLGDSIRAIERKDATWRLPFLREHTEYSSRDVLLGMLKSLYRGQRDRHGSDAYSDVTHDEAEGAVLMAVTLVGWFSRGLIQERDSETYG